MVGTKISGTGSYLPDCIVTNEDLEKVVDTNDEWITKMTGIKERRVVSPQESTSVLCYHAGKLAIEDAGLSPKDIDMVIVGTSTPDMLFPATASLVQKSLQCRDDIPAFDFEIACSSYVYGLIIASQFIRTGMHRHVLVVTGDVMSRILNYKDRGTCVLFGDGASAFVLSSDPEEHLLGVDWGCNPYEPWEFLYVKGGGSAQNFSEDPSSPVNPHVVMNGPEIYRLAVKKMSESIQSAIEKSGLSSHDVDFVVPHQANIRIMQSVVNHLKLPMEKLISTIEKHGNTSGATVGMALDIARKSGKIRSGHVVGLTAFGAGLAWGSAIIRM